MINDSSFKLVGAHHLDENYIKPAYGSYCFSHIPDTIRRLFGCPSAAPLPQAALPGWDEYDQVVFFFIDAFGWHFFEQYADHPFLRLMAKDGVISQMTAMFPSTTSAHTTSIHTGVPVPQSGVFEWFYYEPIVGEVISPLLFSIAGDKVNGKDVREGLTKRGVTPAQIFPDATIYLDLAEVRVKSFVFNYHEYAHSSFSQHTNRGAEIIPYGYWSEALANLSLMLSQPQHKADRRYFFLYYAAADSLMHHYGPTSPQVESEILAWLDQMQRFVTNLRAQRTLLIISADHGQAETDPANSLAINLALPDLPDVLRRGSTGQIIRFGGSPRDLFLYVQDQALLETRERLQVVMGERGDVKTTAELIAEGCFGPEPVSERLLARLGNLVLLPKPGEAVFWFEKGRFEQRFYGHHGGLSPQEMLIPFIAFPVDTNS